VTIRLLRLGSAAHVLTVSPGSTIQSALTDNGINCDGFDLTLNGLSATGEAALADGDVVVAVPRVKGGATAA
jgi:hypothetical protein